jgi:hypothetical protein
MKPLLPPLAHHEAIAHILIEKHLVALGNQPSMQSTGTRSIHAGITDEYPGHHVSQTSVKRTSGS